MPMSKSTLATKVQCIHEVAEAVGAEVRDNYSGRCMYGDKCYGIVCDDLTAVLMVIGRRQLPKPCFDSMGRGYIVYWPCISKE